MADVSVSRGFLSHPLTIAVILSLLCNVPVMTAPTETNECHKEDHKYYFNNICCDMCAPGHKVESHCTSSNSTSNCVPCPDDYFQKDWSGDTRCTLIDKCDGRFENVSKRALDKTMNNECACNVGYKYSDSEDKRCIEAQDEKQTPLKVPKEHSTTELPKIPQHVVLPRVVIQEYSTAADIQTSTYSSTEITTSIVLPCQPADNDLTDEIISNQNKFHIMLIITVIIIVICLAIVVAFVLVKVCCIKGMYSEKCRTKAATNAANNRGGPLPINNGAGEGNFPMLGSAGNNQSSETAAASTNTATRGVDAPPGNNDGGKEITPMIAEQPESAGNNLPTETAVDADDKGCATRSTVSRADSTESVENHPERSSSESGICREDSIEDQDRNSTSPDDGATPCYTMTDRHRDILRDLTPDIVKDLPVSPVLDKMKLFTMEDIADITNEIHTEYKQRRLFISTLMTKGPNAFDEFVRVLDEVCPHLALALKSQN